MIVNSFTAVVPDLKTETIQAPELGDGAEIKFREWSCGDASDFNDSLSINQADMVGQRKTMKFFALLICSSAVNENNEKISNAAQAEIILDKWPSELILRAGEVAARLQGYTAVEKEKAKKDSPLNQPPQ